LIAAPCASTNPRHEARRLRPKHLSRIFISLNWFFQSKVSFIASATSVVVLESLSWLWEDVLSRCSLSVSRYKAGKSRQRETGIRKPRKARAAPGPYANRTASTWPGQAPPWMQSEEQKDTPTSPARNLPSPLAPKDRPTQSRSPRAASITAPMVQRNERPLTAHDHHGPPPKPRSRGDPRRTR
jgi:hypothetical protein